MNDLNVDVFETYNLPFETYFTRGCEQINQVHDEIELVWLLRGNATMVCDNKSFLMTPQTVFMINPFQLHSIKSSDDSMIITYRFKKDYLEQINQEFQGLHFYNQVQPLEALVEKYREVPLLISQLMKLLISRDQSELVRYKIIGYYNMLIYELYTMLLKEKYLDIKKKDVKFHIERLNYIIDYLNKNFLKKVSLEELAALLHISKYRLSHLIKESFGISFREYLFNIRFEYALRLLKDTEFSVIEISRLSGFSDVKYLNKLLKERFKTTALKYRKRFKEQLLHITHNDDQDFFEELKICLKNLEHITT